MTGSRRSPAVFATLAALFLCRCSDPPPPEPKPPSLEPVLAAGIQLPVPSDWSIDEKARANESGVVFRMVRRSAVPGSPRIEITVSPDSKSPLVLEDLLARSLRDMAEFEADGKIKITRIDRREVRVGPRRAYRVAHDYLMGSGEPSVALSQLSKLLVVDGRGVTMTAAGRTELFHPLAAEIDKIFGGVEVLIPSQKKKLRERAEREKKTQNLEGVLEEKASQLVEPMELGDE